MRRKGGNKRNILLGTKKYNVKEPAFCERFGEGERRVEGKGGCNKFFGCLFGCNEEISFFDVLAPIFFFFFFFFFSALKESERKWHNSELLPFSRTGCKHSSAWSSSFLNGLQGSLLGSRGGSGCIPG